MKETMQKILIIGINGFAGTYLRKELEFNGYDVYGADIYSKDAKTIAADMLQPEISDRVIEQVRPDGVFNLSGFASPRSSWDHVLQTMHLNVDISVNLAESVKKICPHARLVFIGTSHQYGLSARKGGAVLETESQAPSSPYAVSKCMQEELLKLLANRYHLDALFTRSFNHIGPGQKMGFVVSDFASKIVEIEQGRRNNMMVGDLSAWRDFSDVRDTVRAYRLLYEKGISGEIYNVGSGTAKSTGWILETLLKYSRISSEAVIRTVHSENEKPSMVVCDTTKLFLCTGYQPQHHLEDTLQEVLAYYRKEFE